MAILGQGSISPSTATELTVSLSMPSNYYTAPSTYASRGGPKYKVKTKANFELGIGYTLPAGVNRQQFRKTYAEWEAKLLSSGFTDIEYRSPTHSGHFTPFFRSNGSTATFMRAYDSAKEDYYRLARHFDAYMAETIQVSEPLSGKRIRRTRWSWVFDEAADTYKTVWRMHSDGIPYRGIAAAFSGKPNKWLKGVKLPAPRLISSRSVFWAHDNTHRVLNLFWKWAQSNEQLVDPRD